VSFYLISSRVCSFNSLRAWSSVMQAMSICTPISTLEPSDTQHGVFVLRHIVTVSLHAFLPDRTLDIFVIVACHKQVVRTVLLVRLKATLSVVSLWVNNGIAQYSGGAGEYFCLQYRRRRWFRLRVCNVLNVSEVGKCVQIFDWILVSVEMIILSEFNASGRSVNCQIVLACNLKVFRMV